MSGAHAKERVLVISKINISLPGNRPCRPPTSLDLSHAFDGGRNEVGAVSLFHPFAAATTTKLGPENEPQGLESREHDSFWEETRFRIPQSIRGCMMRDERLI